jgi:MFS family permease
MAHNPEIARDINPWLIAIAVMSSTFMEVLDTTVVNVSLPHIAGNLSATTDEATWTLTSYLVANAIVLPMTGWLASTFGRKRLLMMSVTGFTLASFFCGLALAAFSHHLSCHPGRLWWWAAAIVAGHPAGIVSSR